LILELDLELDFELRKTVSEQLLCLSAQPQKYRSPSRKGGISPASRAVEGWAGLKL
jgi:hypothetical protein